MFILCKNEKRTILMHVVVLDPRLFITRGHFYIEKSEWKIICNKIPTKSHQIWRKTDKNSRSGEQIYGGGGGAHCALVVANSPLGLCRVKNDNQMFLPTYRYKYNFYTTWCAYISVQQDKIEWVNIGVSGICRPGGGGGGGAWYPMGGVPRSWASRCRVNVLFLHFWDPPLHIPLLGIQKQSALNCLASKLMNNKPFTL